MEWKKAIVEVLSNVEGPMHYGDIASEISRRRLRKKAELGATPANTVAVMISNSLRDDDHSPFIRVSRGYYALRDQNGSKPTKGINDSVPPTTLGLVNAIGMYWERSKVLWSANPKLYGKQQPESEPVDFSNERGVYFLHDAQGIVYVGRTTEQPLGRRLSQHTSDRLNGRWSRFSWFGIYPAQADGALNTSFDHSTLTVDILIATLESVLIEGLEPRQNRKRGDDLQSVEFLQHEDPSIETQRKKALLSELAATLGTK